MSISKERAHLRARYANAVLRGDDEAAAEYRRDLAAQAIKEFIQSKLATVGPLTSAQADVLAATLHNDAEVAA
ncbi:hypothetical protein AB0F44_01120 [Nocardioides sp. NPDC023903]|uniref:hypothetical protein n=1 Tax=Nocardioides sp. NPDC023903 TaxID=3157195 RepID=UPI0033DDEE43